MKTIDVLSFIINIFDKSWKHMRKSYSQEGEDLVLFGFLDEIKNGFYVDIGAHHPFRFSNTYYFYKKGWRGINIDATPGSMGLFKKYRSKDINLEVPVSSVKGKLDYYIFSDPALNSFSQRLSEERNSKTKYKIEKIIKLTPKKLSEILDNYLPKNTKVNFMSIDVEGSEYEVLLSNNWNRYSPEYLLIEILGTDYRNIQKNKLSEFLATKDYTIVGITGRTVIFKKHD